MSAADYSHHVSKHRSAGMRMLFAALGCLFVALGVAGAFLPLLPATPFMLLAAACFARASTRFYNRLLNTPAFGPAILEWREHRSINHRVKLSAIAVMAVTLAVSILTVIEQAWLQGLLAAFGLLLALGMYRIPSRDAPVQAYRRTRPE
jgi:uncharacterized membrane protein YbaN (DUF454 family)